MLQWENEYRSNKNLINDKHAIYTNANLTIEIYNLYNNNNNDEYVYIYIFKYKFITPYILCILMFWLCFVSLIRVL